MKKHKKISPDHPYICDTCAKLLGGVWPKGHCATIHSDICWYCKTEKALACIGDYNWPKANFEYMRD